MGRRGATTRELQELYHARFEHFVRVAASICGDGDSGRDAVQAAFVSAVRTRRSFRGDGSLEAWIWRMVVNEARRLARATRARAVGRDESGRDAERRWDDPFGVRAVVAALPPRQREVVFLRYYADLEYRDDRRGPRDRAGNGRGHVERGAPRAARADWKEVRP